MLVGLASQLVQPALQEYTPQDVLNDLSTRPAWVQCIVQKEVGRSITRSGTYYAAYDPYMPGLQGERGPVQLHPAGLLNDFYKQGYTNPYNPQEAHDYLEQARQRGLINHWPTSRGCI